MAMTQRTVTFDEIMWQSDMSTARWIAGVCPPLANDALREFAKSDKGKPEPHDTQ